MNEDNGNGIGVPANRRRLEELLEFHQKRADAIRLTLSVLDEGTTQRKQQGIHTVMRQAAALDRERQKELVPTVRDRLTNQRRETEKLLASMSRTEPQAISQVAGALAQHGYIKQKGAGWVRTDKPFNPEQAVKQYAGKAATQKIRFRTAKRLAKMSLTDPKPYGKGAGILVLHGYLTATDTGYLRTDKLYIP